MEITETSQPQDMESATLKVLQSVSSEPACRASLYKMLAYCETARTSVEIEQEALSYPEMKVSLHSSLMLLTRLVQSGGIERIAAKDATPLWRTTPAGRDVVRIEGPSKRLEALLAQNPGYRDVFFQVLQSCLAPKTKGEIEAMLHGNPVLVEPKVFAGFFIGELEKAGGLEWNEKWRTTQAGKEFAH
ncbi:MAG: hypothetical protein AB9872_04205 [Solidesulfovibrio sp.]